MILHLYSKGDSFLRTEGVYKKDSGEGSSFKRKRVDYTSFFNESIQQSGYETSLPQERIYKFFKGEGFKFGYFHPSIKKIDFDLVAKNNKGKKC